MTAEIRQVDPKTSPEWARLVERAPSDVFHSPQWSRVLDATYGLDPHALVLGPEGDPEAGIVFAFVDGLKGRRCGSLPFSDFCDPLVSEREHWDLLLGRLEEAGHPIRVRARANEVVRSDSRFETAGRAHWHGLDLRQGAESAWEAMDSSCRRAVRKAEKSGVEVRRGTDLQDVRTFYELHLGVRKHKYHLLPQPFGFFENIWKEFFERDEGFLLLAEREGRPIAGVLFLQWKDRLYYKFNASEPDSLQYRPNDLIIWTAIQWAAQRGFGVLDFGLSDWEQEGLARYKRKFGSDEGDILFLERVPPTASPPQESKLAPVMSELTELLTEDDVPDHTTEQAAQLLYRFFA